MKHKKMRNYFKAREIEEKPQIQAEHEAGYASDHHGTTIEKTKMYQKLKEKYADVLEKKTNFDELAGWQVRNAKQDKDKGASNKALESIINRLEPTEGEELNVGDVQIVVKRND